MEKLIGQFHDESKESYLKQIEALNKQIEMIGRKRKPSPEHLIEASFASAVIDIIQHFNIHEYGLNSFTPELNGKISNTVKKNNVYGLPYSTLEEYEHRYNEYFLTCTISTGVINALTEMRNIALDYIQILEAELINLANITELTYTRFSLLAQQGIPDIAYNRMSYYSKYKTDKTVFLYNNKEATGTPIFNGHKDDDTGQISVHDKETSRIASPDTVISKALVPIRGYNLFSLALAEAYNLKELYAPITLSDSNLIKLYLEEIQKNSYSLYNAIEENKDINQGFNAIYNFVRDYNVDFNPLNNILIENLKNPHIFKLQLVEKLFKNTVNTIKHKKFFLTQAPYYIIKDLGESIYEAERNR